MSSFYDNPRSAPVPASIEKFIASPAVPEVSMIFNKPHSSTENNIPNSRTHFPTYSSWRQRNQQNIDPMKENIFPPVEHFVPVNSSLLKKQVRFKSSASQKPTSSQNEQVLNGLPKVLSVSNSNYRTQNKDFSKDCVEGGKSMPTNFEQIYLANIPNRHLDLSLIDCRYDQKNMKEMNANNFDVCDYAKKHFETYDTCEFRGEKRSEDIKCTGGFIKPSGYNTEFNFDKDVNLQDKTLQVNQEKSQKSIPRSYKEYCAYSSKVRPDHDEPVADVYKYRSDKKLHRNQSLEYSPTDCINQNKYIFDNFHQETKSKPEMDNITQTSTVDLCSKQENGKEPTVKDLLKIIQQQNEQLLLLQKQVSKLLENQEIPKQIDEAPKVKQIEPSVVNHVGIFGEKLIASTEHEILKSQDLRKNTLPKFAIDVMTSFEVSIRPQQQRRFPREYVNHEPRITEITEVDSNCEKNLGCTGLEDWKEKFDQNKFASMTLNEPLAMREESVSPVNSIHVDMQDYSSDESDDNEISPDVGLTFYNNVMGQVNNILQKAQKMSEDDQSSVVNDKIKHKTMRKVKEATIKHLKSIGVSVPQFCESDGDDSQRSRNSEYTPTEVSFAVQQLLMKYLPGEQLAKMMRKESANVPVELTKGENLITKRPDFSFATLQYMKKYNLISSKYNDVPVRGANLQRNVFPKQNDGAPKILDITALKQQPKLL